MDGDREQQRRIICSGDVPKVDEEERLNLSRDYLMEYLLA